MVDATTSEVTELLQQLIRNACVNDGMPDSGNERRSADLLESYFEGTGLDQQRFEPLPGRGNLVVRMEGSDPSAPSLALMGHIDVVPVNPSGWERDPFGGELVEDVVWGRGAVDMLNLTASMAVAVKQLAASGFRPRGNLIFLAVADEEALGTHGAWWLPEHERDAVFADYVVTEAGGLKMPLPSTTGPKLVTMVGEKGSFWCHLRVHGTPGHGSMPYRTDNALVKAAEVVRRIADYRPQTRIVDAWRSFVERSDLPPEMGAMLMDPDRVAAFIEAAPEAGLARMVHACTHTTFAPTIMHAGVKTNVIPDSVELQLDIRTLPGQSGADIRAMLDEALGDLAASVELTASFDNEASASPVDTPLWDSLQRVTGALVPGAETIPFLLVGATDARFYRRAGATAYGAGLFSDRFTFADFATMFHGDNERVDQESLRLSTALWDGVARDLLG